MDEKEVQEATHGFKPWEKLGLALLLVIMVVSTFSTALASQQAQKAAKNTDVLATCFTPGTACANLMVEGTIRTTAENKCVIAAIIDFPPLTERASRRDEILSNYETCVTSEIAEIKARPVLNPLNPEKTKP